MASTKLAFQAVAVLLLQASWCALSQQGETAAVLSMTSFEEHPASCDGKLHQNGDRVAAMSTDWFNARNMCQKYIYISHSPNPNEGDSVLVEVVGECDTQSGCKANTIAATERIWLDLRLDTSLAEVPVNWTLAY